MMIKQLKQFGEAIEAMQIAESAYQKSTIQRSLEIRKQGRNDSHDVLVNLVEIKNTSLFIVRLAGVNASKPKTKLHDKNSPIHKEGADWFVREQKKLQNGITESTKRRIKTVRRFLLPRA